jgi:hypothetical protein
MHESNLEFLPEMLYGSVKIVIFCQPYFVYCHLVPML